MTTTSAAKLLDDATGGAMVDREIAAKACLDERVSEEAERSNDEDAAYNRACKDCASAIRALPSDDGWQPIESAPKDGTYILLGNECGAWVGRYQAVYQSGYVPSNPWQSLMLNHDHMGAHWNSTPSKWKPLLSPLPKPPEPRG